MVWLSRNSNVPEPSGITSSLPRCGYIFGVRGSPGPSRSPCPRPPVSRCLSISTTGKKSWNRWNKNNRPNTAILTYEVISLAARDPIRFPLGAAHKPPLNSSRTLITIPKYEPNGCEEKLCRLATPFTLSRRSKWRWMVHDTSEEMKPALVTRRRR